MLHKGVAAVVLMAAISFPTLANHEQVPAFMAELKIICVRDQGKIDHGLRTNSSEAPIRRGYAADGSVMQLYSSRDGETWSLTMLAPDGNECLVMSGSFLKDVPWILGVIDGNKT